MSYENFKSFLENSFSNSDPLLEAKRYTDDIESLQQMILEMYPFMSNQALKNRVTRLGKKITKLLNKGNESNQTSDTESESSQSSQA